MNYEEIKITQRRNLGNFEHREITLSASFNEGDDFDSVYNKVNEQVKRTLGYESTSFVKETAEAVETTVEAAPAPKKKAPAKKRTTKKAKEPVVVPTLEEMTALCRKVAGELKSADKVKSLIQEACQVDSLKEADENTFVELKKLLEKAV